MSSGLTLRASMTRSRASSSPSMILSRVSSSGLLRLSMLNSHFCNTDQKQHVRMPPSTIHCRISNFLAEPSRSLQCENGQRLVLQSLRGTKLLSSVFSLCGEIRFGLQKSLCTSYESSYSPNMLSLSLSQFFSSSFSKKKKPTRKHNSHLLGTCYFMHLQALWHLFQC